MPKDIYGLDILLFLIIYQSSLNGPWGWWAGFKSSAWTVELWPKQEQLH